MANLELPKAIPNPQSLADLTALLPDPGSDGYEFFEHSGNHPLEKSTDFRQVNAWWTMEMSYLSYATQKQFALDRIHEAGLNGSAFGFERQDPPHILVAYSPDVMTVAFRGTRIDQFPDILADISFLPDVTAQGLVHHGFHQALVSGGVWDQAQEYISGIAGGQAILFTGHSLGAALATIARRNFHDRAGRRMALYTFGSPRVGDQLIYCPGYPGPAYRVVNDEDVVTHVPTPPLYGHVGTPLSTGGEPLSGSVWEDLEHRFSGAGGALSVFSLDARRRRLQQYFSAQLAFKPIGDHAPKAYATKIWNALIGAPTS